MGNSSNRLIGADSRLFELDFDDNNWQGFGFPGAGIIGRDFGGGTPVSITGAVYPGFLGAANFIIDTASNQQYGYFVGASFGLRAFYEDLAAGEETYFFMSNFAHGIQIGVRDIDVMVFLDGTGNQRSILIDNDSVFGGGTGDTTELRFKEVDSIGSRYVGFRAPLDISNTTGVDTIWTLPTGDGSSGDVLATNGAGDLTWVTPAGGGGNVDEIQDLDTDTYVRTEDNSDEDIIRMGWGPGLSGITYVPSGSDNVQLSNQGISFQANTVGAGQNFSGTPIQFIAGAGDGTGQGGPITMAAGSGSNGNGFGGDINFNAGKADTGIGGSIRFQPGDGIGGDGIVELRAPNPGPGRTADLIFRDLTGTDGVGFKAPDSAGGGTTIWTLPVGDGNLNDVLSTDGAGNLSWQPQSSGTIVYKDNTTVVANTAVETNLVNYAVPAGQLNNPNTALKLNLEMAHLENAAGNGTITFRVYYGTTLMYEATTTNFGDGALERGITAHLFLGNRAGVATSQYVKGHMVFATAAGGTTGGSPPTTVGHGNISTSGTGGEAPFLGAASENSANAHNFRVTAQFNAGADPNRILTVLWADITLL